jgi:TetR/AcrR family transcriptional repressor of lmrAB and yxaGH operons
MRKGEESRRKLVDATAKLLRRQGFHATGLAQIVEESGAPRGSLYFYFPNGKEELACAALEQAGGEWRTALLAAGAIEPLSLAIEAVVTLIADQLEASAFADGCPLATVALEASAASEAVRALVARHYDGWREILAARLRAAKIDRARAESTATFVLAAIEGALLLAKVGKSRAPLETVGKTLKAMIDAMAPADEVATNTKRATKRRSS